MKEVGVYPRQNRFVPPMLWPRSLKKESHPPAYSSCILSFTSARFLAHLKRIVIIQQYGFAHQSHAAGATSTDIPKPARQSVGTYLAVIIE
jgi:hypothetical protein